MAISYVGPPPASGAWQEGDNPGGRKFIDVGSIELELGGVIPNVRVAYETYGELNAEASNAVLVLHALTGDAHVAGPDGPGQATEGWWDGLVGPGLALDTDEWFVVCPNVLGGCQGTTGPSSPASDGRPWGSRFPYLTIRDQVAVELAFSDALGIGRWAFMLGGSMGGMRALEWAISSPDRVGAALLLAAGAEASADEIGLYSAQLLAIEADNKWRGGDYYDASPGHGPTRGMGIARRIAHLSYRSDTEFESRFGRAAQGGEDPLRGGRYAVESYLDHQADKLARRFDAGSYVVLTRAMNTHDVGRGRGGVEAALSSIRVALVVAGLDSDRLYPLRLQREIVELVPTSTDLRVINSPLGHDGFLLEIEAVGALVRETAALSLADSAARGAAEQSA
jgi:homoserine O-acetyltransferase